MIQAPTILQNLSKTSISRSQKPIAQVGQLMRYQIHQISTKNKDTSSQLSRTNIAKQQLKFHQETNHQTPLSDISETHPKVHQTRDLKKSKEARNRSKQAKSRKRIENKTNRIENLPRIP